MACLNNHDFHNIVIATGNGNELAISNTGIKTTLAIAITGTATVRTVIFECKGLNGVYTLLRLANVATGAFATQTIGTGNEIWVADVTGLSNIRARISAISGGNLTVQGKVVG